jgi:hypothetical protein
MVGQFLHFILFIVWQTLGSKCVGRFEHASLTLYATRLQHAPYSTPTHTYPHTHTHKPEEATTLVSAS